MACDYNIELVLKNMKHLLRLNQRRSTHRTSGEATVRALLIAWALQESTTTWLRTLLRATASPERVVVRSWLVSFRSACLLSHRGFPACLAVRNHLLG